MPPNDAAGANGKDLSNVPTVEHPHLDFRRSVVAGDPEERWRRLLYWLAGARPETLKVVDAAERERIATIGMSVLIPSVMGFVGMYLLLHSRVSSSSPAVIGAGAVAWAFIVLNVDRILVSTYRPFAPFGTRLLQMGSRGLLATVVSVAIGLPFCLDLYRPAIRRHADDRVERSLRELRATMDRERNDARTRFATLDGPLEQEQRDIEQEHPAGLTPDAYADDKVRRDLERVSTPGFAAPASAETLAIDGAIDAAEQALRLAEDELQAATARRESRERDLKAELEGRENGLYGTTSRKGTGPRYREIERLVVKERAEENAQRAKDEERRAALARLREQLVERRRADQEAYVRGADAERQQHARQAAVAQAAASEKLADLQRRRAALKQEHDAEIARIEARFLPDIAQRERWRGADLDPLDETVGLYRVIFESSAGDVLGGAEAGDGARAWAGLLQFGVVFLVLLLVDLVPIITKFASPPGTYDALIAAREEVAAANFAALRRSYPQVAGAWFEEHSGGLGDRRGLADRGLSTTDSASLARLLFTMHPGLPGALRRSCDWALRDAQPHGTQTPGAANEADEVRKAEEVA